MRAQELSAERVMVEADLTRKLGTLRYLKGLQAARRRAVAAAQPGAAAPPPFVYSKGAFACPGTFVWGACQWRCPKPCTAQRSDRITVLQLGYWLGNRRR